MPKPKPKKKPPRNLSWVGKNPHSPAQPMAVVRAPAQLSVEQWKEARGRCWIVRQWDASVRGEHHWVYGRTNVPLCCDLAVPVHVLPHCERIEVGYEEDNAMCVVEPHCTPYSDPTMGVTKRLSMFGTGQRPVHPDPNLILSTAQTFLPTDTDVRQYQPRPTK